MRIEFENSGKSERTVSNNSPYSERTVSNDSPYSEGTLNMSQEISKAEVQLCLAAKNIRKPSFTKDDLLGFGQMAFKEELEDWSAAFDSFCRQNLFRADGDHYSLTPEGEKYAEQIVTRELFGKMFVRAERSLAFGRFCERVYGKNLTQFGTADMDQLE